jgi:hypothetical protein
VAISLIAVVWQMVKNDAAYSAAVSGYSSMLSKFAIYKWEIYLALSFYFCCCCMLVI